jgi:hypothetical protein
MFPIYRDVPFAGGIDQQVLLAVPLAAYRATLPLQLCTTWTPAVGDVKLYGNDGTSIGNIADLPTAIGNGVWLFSFNKAELSWPGVTVVINDLAGNEVASQAFVLETTARQSILLGQFQSTAPGSGASVGLPANSMGIVGTEAYDNALLPGRELVFVSTGTRRTILAASGSPGATITLTLDASITSSDRAANGAYYIDMPRTQDVARTRLPAALVNGRIDASVGAVAAGAITAAAIADGAVTNAKLADNAIGASKIATDAIAGAKIAADAVTKIQTGLSTAATLALVKTQTDKLAFNGRNEVAADIKAVINDPVVANSTKQTNWGGTA